MANHPKNITMLTCDALECYRLSLGSCVNRQCIIFLLDTPRKSRAPRQESPSPRPLSARALARLSWLCHRAGMPNCLERESKHTMLRFGSLIRDGSVVVTARANE